MDLKETEAKNVSAGGAQQHWPTDRPTAGVAAMKSSYEMDASQREQEPLNTDTEVSTALGADTRQKPMKTQQSKKNYCVLLWSVECLN
jgi:hypothetical protein